VTSSVRFLFGRVACVLLSLAHVECGLDVQSGGNPALFSADANEGCLQGLPLLRFEHALSVPLRQALPLFRNFLRLTYNHRDWSDDQIDSVYREEILNFIQEWLVNPKHPYRYGVSVASGSASATAVALPAGQVFFRDAPTRDDVLESDVSTEEIRPLLIGEPVLSPIRRDDYSSERDAEKAVLLDASRYVGALRNYLGVDKDLLSLAWKPFQLFVFELLDDDARPLYAYSAAPIARLNVKRLFKLHRQLSAKREDNMRRFRIRLVAVARYPENGLSVQVAPAIWNGMATMQSNRENNFSDVGFALSPAHLENYRHYYPDSAPKEPVVVYSLTASDSMSHVIKVPLSADQKPKNPGLLQLYLSLNESMSRVSFLKPSILQRTLSQRNLLDPFSKQYPDAYSFLFPPTQNVTHIEDRMLALLSYIYFSSHRMENPAAKQIPIAAHAFLDETASLIRNANYLEALISSKPKVEADRPPPVCALVPLFLPPI